MLDTCLTTQTHTCIYLCAHTLSLFSKHAPTLSPSPQFFPLSLFFAKGFYRRSDKQQIPAPIRDFQSLSSSIVKQESRQGDTLVAQWQPKGALLPS